MKNWFKEIPFSLVRIGKGKRWLKYPILLLLSIIVAVCEMCDAVKILASPKMRRRIMASVLAFSMMLTLIPTTVFAAEPTQGASQSVVTLCEHHTEHTPECGYTEGTAGTPCSHEHTEDCYKEVTNCTHAHMADCYPADSSVSDNAATASGAEKKEPTQCSHICSEETGCITKAPDCLHTKGTHDVTCSYAAGTACGFVCEVCNQADVSDAVKAVLALIDALPTLDELAAVDTEGEGFADYLAKLRLDTAAARTTYDALTDEQKAEFDPVVLAKLTELEEVLAAMPVMMSDAIPTLSADANNSYQNVKYTLIAGTPNGTATVSGVVSKTAVTGVGNVLTIPTQVQKDGTTYDVIAIGKNAFSGCARLTAVTMLTSVTSIEESAFYKCASLSEITIPNSVATIGKNAFYECTSLATVTIPTSVTSIGTTAFQYCSSLDALTIPASVTTIGTNAFSNIKNGAVVTLEHIILSGNGINADSFKTELMYYYYILANPAIAKAIGENYSSQTSYGIFVSKVPIEFSAQNNNIKLIMALEGAGAVYERGYNVLGVKNGTGIGTTYNGNGYPTYLSTDAAPTVGNSKPVRLPGEGAESYVKSGIWVKTDGEFISDGKYLRVTYTLRNSTDAAINNVSLGVAADTMIAYNDNADIFPTATGFRLVDTTGSGMQFTLNCKNATGADDVDTMWYGVWSNNFKNNLFTDLGEKTDLIGKDSVITFSWKNMPIPANGSITRSVVFGVNAAAAPPILPADGSKPIALYLTTEGQKDITVNAKVTDTTGVNDTLYYTINDGTEQQLGETVTADGTEKTIAGNIAASNFTADGEYTVKLWIMNSKGAMSEVITKVLTVTDGAMGGAGLETGDAPVTPTPPAVCTCVAPAMYAYWVDTTNANSTFPCTDYAFPATGTALGGSCEVGGHTATHVAYTYSFVSATSGNIATVATKDAETTLTFPAADTYTMKCVASANGKETSANKTFTLSTAAPKITVTINGGAEVGGTSLENAIGSTTLSSITNLTITKGEVTADDWKWLKDLTKLTDFTIADDAAVTKVADIPNATSVNIPIFPKSIVNVSIPQAITIGSYVFKDCTALTTASFPAATSIGTAAFFKCSGLTDIDLSKATSITNLAFYECKALKSISFPAATSIGEEAFYSCNALETARFPKVTSIGDSAFKFCQRLATLKLGATVPTTVGTDAFANCLKTTLTLVDASGNVLTDADLTTAQAAYDAVKPGGGTATDGLWFGWKVRDAAAAVCTCTVSVPTFVSSNVEIPADQASTTYALQASGSVRSGDCKVLGHKDTAVTYGYAERTDTSNIASITGTTLTVTGAGSVIVIATAVANGKYATTDATFTVTKAVAESKITIKINDNQTEHGGATLKAAVDTAKGSNAYTTITKLTVTKGEVTAADWTWFKGGSSNNSTPVLDELTHFTIDASIADGKVANIPNGAVVNDTNHTIFPTSIKAVIIPQAITVGEYSFTFRPNLVTVNLPAATSIGKSAFQACGKLTTVSFPAATSIGESAFSMCTALASVSIPNVSNISANAFYFGIGLATLELGTTPPTTVGVDAFTSCPKTTLTLVDASGNALTESSNPKLSVISALYDAVTADGGTTTDGLWYGWKVREPIISAVEAEWMPTGGVTASGTLLDGFAALKTTGGTIKLVTNITKTQNFNGTLILIDASYLQPIIFDLAGNKLAFTGGNQSTALFAALENAALFTITDSSAGKTGGISMVNGFVACAGDTAKLALSGGTYTASGSLGGNIPVLGAIALYDAPDVTLDEQKAILNSFCAQGFVFDPATHSFDTNVSMAHTAATVKVVPTATIKPAPGGKLETPLTQGAVDGVFGEGNATLDNKSTPPTIHINNDITPENLIKIETDVTIDLGGNTITGKTGETPIIVGDNDKVTIDGSGTIAGGDSTTGTGGNGITGGTGSEITIGKDVIVSGGDGTSGGDGINSGGNVIVDGAVQGGNGSGGTSGNHGGDGADTSTGSGNITIDNGGSASGGNGGNVSGGTGGNGGNGTNSGSGSTTVDGETTGGSGGNGSIGGGSGGSGSTSTGGGNITVDGETTGGSGGNASSGTGGKGGNGTSTGGNGDTDINNGGSTTGGAGGNGSSAGGNGGSGTSSGTVTVDDGGSATGGSGGNGGSGTGGTGGNGSTSTGNANIDGETTGGNGGSGTATGGNGGNGAASGTGSSAGDITVGGTGDAAGGNGGSATGGSGTGGNGGNGSTTGGRTEIETGGTTTGGTGGSGAAAGGNGGNGTDTTGTDTTINGGATGGTGGTGNGNGSGGNGGAGANQGGGTVGGSGTATGGNGGNGAGTGSGGSGGVGVGGGASAGSNLDVKPGTSARKATAEVDDSKSGTTVTVPDKSTLADAALNEIEKNDPAIREVNVVLNVEKKNNQPDKAAVDAVLNQPTVKADTIGAFFDITLDKIITNAGGTQPSVSVKQASKEIEITITIPTDMRGGSNYVVIRVHNGSGSALATMQSGDNLTFKTDKFSTYAIAYTKAGAEADPTAPTSPPTPPTPPTSPPTPPTGGNNNSGGGGSSSGSYTPPVTVIPSDKLNMPTTAETEIKAAVDTNGNGAVNLSSDVVEAAIKKAVDEAKKAGTIENGMVVVINVSTDGKNANSMSVNLPRTTQEYIISNKVSQVTLVMKNPAISIGLNLAAVTEINRQAQADVQLTATRLTNTAGMSAAAKAAIGTRPAFALTATYQNGAKAVSNVGSGKVIVAIPYTLSPKENPGSLYAVYADENGKVNYLTESSYNANSKAAIFADSHFRTYAVGYKAIAFTDISGHWAKNDIEFVASRDLLIGTDTSIFGPDTSVTRAMFVTALGRLAGIDNTKYKTSAFTDVKEDAYYTPYVVWAAAKNIVSGTTTTTFAPDQAITRQEMALIMQNYAKAMNYTVPKTRELVSFADNAGIGDWAAEAVKSMQMAGVIMGKDSNRFDPAGIATRGEVSAVLHRYIELAIDKATAQGLDLNDSGKIVYYENGRLFTGIKTIDGSTYYFGADGICGKIDAVVPDTKKYITYIIVYGDTLWDLSRKHKCTVAEIVGMNGIEDPNNVPIGTEIKIPQK